MQQYKTSDIAKAVGVHPNTVRLYEEWGFLHAVPRKPNGYRVYSEQHLDQMCLARTALQCEFCEAGIRELSIAIIKTAAVGQLESALEQAYAYLTHVETELFRAEEALLLIDDWMKNEVDSNQKIVFTRSKAAKLLEVSIDVLRNWERNGLIEVQRNPDNRYRTYQAQDIKKLKIIRTLRMANYSMMAILKMIRHIEAGGSHDVRSIVASRKEERFTDEMDELEDMRYATDQWIVTLGEVKKSAYAIIEQLKNNIKKRDQK